MAAASSYTLNKYDWLKLLALASMSFDHIGAYLLPEAEWIRAIGRCSFPIWLFLAGYGSAKLPSRALLGMALLVALLQFSWTGELLPQNILISIAIIRLLLWLDTRQQLTSRQMNLLFAVGLLCALPTLTLWDYGTLALLFALLGRWHYCRQKAAPAAYHIVSWVTYWGVQGFFSGFGGLEWALMLAACLPVAKLLYHFKPDTAQVPTFSAPTNALLHWLSRHSLYYYGAHLALLVPLGAWLLA